MIYKTIPGKYLDLSDLAKFLRQGLALRSIASWVADEGLEKLQQDLTSGQAVIVGQNINAVKNMEFHTIDIMKKLCTLIQQKYKNISEQQLDEASHVADEVLKAVQDSHLVGLRKAYHDWQDQIPHILDKYAKGYGSYHEVADFDMCEYGAVERYAT